MRICTNRGDLLPIFGRCAKIWRRACEYRKMKRKAQMDHIREIDAVLEELDQACDAMEALHCEFSGGEGCLLEKCVHFSRGYGSRSSVVAKRNRSSNYEWYFEGSASVTPPSCKLWKLQPTRARRVK